VTSPTTKEVRGCGGSSSSSISVDFLLLGGGLKSLLTEDLRNERAELGDRLEASRTARCDVLNTANNVSGIRVAGDLYDEGTARG
jgi:hypothetical protein